MDDRNRRRRVTYRPSRAGGVVSLIFGLVFVAVGIFVVIPQAGWFGIVWTALAAVITVANVYAAFGGKYGRSQIEIEDDDAPHKSDAQARLEELRTLYDQRLITEEEYEKKRAEIIERL